MRHAKKQEYGLFSGGWKELIETIEQILGVGFTGKEFKQTLLNILKVKKKNNTKY